MIPHIKNTCKTAFFHLRNIARIRKFISAKTTEILIHAFITSKLDNCNSILFGLPKYLIDRLQAVQNASARLITLTKKREHISPIRDFCFSGTRELLAQIEGLLCKTSRVRVHAFNFYFIEQ